MSQTTQPHERSGLLSGGNWIIDQVKIIDVYPKHEQLANIYSQSQGTGGSPYNVLLDLAKMGAQFPLEGAGSVTRTCSEFKKLSPCLAILSIVFLPVTVFLLLPLIPLV